MFRASHLHFQYFWDSWSRQRIARRIFENSASYENSADRVGFESTNGRASAPAYLVARAKLPALAAIEETKAKVEETRRMLEKHRICTYSASILLSLLSLLLVHDADCARKNKS